MKISELKDLATKIVKEMSGTTGGGANVTGNGTGEQYFAPVQTKKTEGRVKDNYNVTHFGYTPAPSIPNRKSKAMDYKKLFELENAEFFIQIKNIKDVQNVQSIVADDNLLKGKFKNRGTDVYITRDPEAAREFIDVLNQNGIRNVNNVEDYTDDLDEVAGDNLDAIKNNVISWSKSRRNAKQDSLESNWWKHFDDTIMNATTKADIKATVLDMYYMGDFDWSKLGLDEAYDKAKIKTNADELARVEDMIKTATSSQMASQEDRIKKLRILVSLEKKHNTQLPTLHYGTYWVDYLNQQGVKNSQELDAKLSAKGEDLNENYSQFRNKTSRRDGAEQLHKAVKEIKKKLEEVDRLIEYTDRLRTEVSEGAGEVKYNTHTTRALEQIQEKIKHTYIKAKKLK